MIKTTRNIYNQTKIFFTVLTLYFLVSTNMQVRDFIYRIDIFFKFDSRRQVVVSAVRLHRQKGLARVGRQRSVHRFRFGR